MSFCHGTLDPLGIFLAISGAKGERLAFRYPFERTHTKQTRGANPYELIADDDDHWENRNRKKSYRSSSLVLDEAGCPSGAIKLRNFTDKTLANMFAYIKTAMLNEKYEVKVDDVIFVGHPQNVSTNSHKVLK